MNTSTVNDIGSLRDQAERWLGSGTSLHVLVFGRTREGHRYVGIEARCPSCVRSLLFFRHQEGDWRVYPVCPSLRR